MKCIQRLMIYLGVNCVLNPFSNRITYLINYLIHINTPAPHLAQIDSHSPLSGAEARGPFT